MPESRILVTDDGVAIACDTYGDPTNGIIILAPGFWRRRKSPVMVMLAEHFAARGFAVHVFDFRGHGDSKGAYTFGLEETRDLAAVLAHAVEGGRGKPLHVLGFSLGGSIAVRTLAEREELKNRVRNLTTVCSPADFTLLKIPLLKVREGLPQLRLYEAVRPPRISLKAYLAPKPRYADFAPLVSPVPLHIVHTECDWLVDVRHAHILYEAAREPKNLHILKDEESLHADALVQSRFGEFSGLLEKIFSS